MTKFDEAYWIAEAAKMKAESEAQIVGAVFGKPVTRGELSVAFDKVANKANWKAPIKKTVVIANDLEMAMVAEAVVFFTGSKAKFKAKGWNKYEVTAAGYYAAIGA